MSTNTNDPKGSQDICRIAVAVGDAELIEPTEDRLDDFVEQNFYVDENGNQYPFDRNTGLGKVTFSMATNTTCKGTWEAENVLKCGMYSNNLQIES